MTERRDRICKLCTKNEIGDEYHYLHSCDQKEIKDIRSELESKINNLSGLYSKLSKKQQFIYLISLTDKDTWLWLGIALTKIFKIVQESYGK